MKRKVHLSPSALWLETFMMKLANLQSKNLGIAFVSPEELRRLDEIIGDLESIYGSANFDLGYKQAVLDQLQRSNVAEIEDYPEDIQEGIMNGSLKISRLPPAMPKKDAPAELSLSDLELDL